ncbi:MAG: bis(5'-nucleosyl)-tetraphosphatase (symmetrical) YqeK [Oscillospiraceae bacterium]
MLEHETIGVYKAYLKTHLSKKRYQHSLNVAVEAVRLADRYGIDRDKAYVAGLLHDAAKEADPALQKSLTEASPLDVSDVEKSAFPLYHAIAGAQLVQSALGVTDAEIVSAIRYHTVARAGMSGLEQIIYLADLISVDRDYRDVKRMRRIAFDDLGAAMYEALKFALTDDVAKMNTIPPSKLAAYNEYTARIKKARSKEAL